MTPVQARAAYRRQLTLNGEKVTLQRGSSAPVSALARVMGFAPDDVTGDVQQGDRKVCILVDDLAVEGFPLPAAKNDTLIWNGKTLRVTGVDDATARVAGVLIAYWLVVAGA